MTSARARADQYARRVNRAMKLLAEGLSAADTARRLAEQFEVSERQAWRYVREATDQAEPLDVPEPKVVFTVKLPESLVDRIRDLAASRGKTLSSLVTEALEGLLQRLRPGQPDGGRRHEG